MPEQPDAETGAIVVVGGTAGLGRAVAEPYARRDRTVIVSSRDRGRAEAAAAEIGGKTTGIALDLSRPQELAGQLAEVGPVQGLALVAVERDYNTVADYDVEKAIRLVTIKLVGYTEVVHALMSRLTPNGSVVLFGGLAKERPYPGSTTITTVNDAMTGLTRTLCRELAPLRVNAIHPGIVGNHPEWSTKPRAVLDAVVARTPLGRLVTLDEVASATAFLLDHPSVNGINLFVDGGWMVT
jgi:NAD(P)-dependent dehydrogenase (short-subunit alcohol dehydrogenase family)